MFEYDLFGTRVTYTLYHRCMIHSIGEKDAIRELGAESGKSSVVGDVAGRKDERSVFAMKGCQFPFEGQVHYAISRYVASSTCASAIFV